MLHEDDIFRELPPELRGGIAGYLIRDMFQASEVHFSSINLLRKEPECLEFSIRAAYSLVVSFKGPLCDLPVAFAFCPGGFASEQPDIAERCGNPVNANLDCSGLVGFGDSARY